jgi:flagellar M-ring protein FliF
VIQESDVNQIIEQLRKFYDGLEPRRQRILWAALALTAVTLVGVGIWASSDSYQVIYNDTDAEALASAKAALEERNIPYRVSSDGGSISVPQHFAGEAKVDIASTGNVVGLEIIETISAGTTPRREDWYYQRALQGELTRTLLALDEIEACRVHIVLPDESAFLRERRAGSASVSLRLRSGRTLGARQIAGITALVAGAVQGLDPDHVVLTDASGNILTDTEQSDAFQRQASNLLEKQRAEERGLVERLQNSLTKLLGSPERFDVSVAVTLDDTTLEETIQELDPNSQVTISEQLIEEESSGSTASGVPGSESNLPEKRAATSNGTERSSTQTQANYDYTKRTTHTTRMAGTVERVSASITVDSTAITEIIESSEGRHTEESLQAALEASIQDAIGFQQARGDSITLAFMPFNAELALASAELTEAPLDLLRYLPYTLAALALLLVFGFVVRPMMSVAMKGTAPDPAMAMGPDGTLIAVADGEPAEDDVSLADRLRHMVDNFETVDARELNRLVEAQTEASTEVLRRWMQGA